VAIEIVEQPISALAEHAKISIAFTVSRVLHIVENGDSLSFVERRLDEPYIKDYDLIESPTEWSERFDISQWGLLAAFSGDERVGGAVIAMGTPGLEMLQGRDDVAALWDIRVAPTMRRRGVGKALFRAAEDWAAARGCVELRIESQNTNVAACQFYEGLWCRLSEINVGVYSDEPDEVQFIWTRRPRAL
jgi:ribosomal protein S18 acetylase RimI-like enzyme